MSSVNFTFSKSRQGRNILVLRNEDAMTVASARIRVVTWLERVVGYEDWKVDTKLDQADKSQWYTVVMVHRVHTSVIQQLVKLMTEKAGWIGWNIPVEEPTTTEPVVEQPTVEPVVEPVTVRSIDWSNLTVKQLRLECQAKDLPSTGLKAELVKRLEATV